jgi:hypothetical protein
VIAVLHYAARWRGWPAARQAGPSADGPGAGRSRSLPLYYPLPTASANSGATDYPASVCRGEGLEHSRACSCSTRPPRTGLRRADRPRGRPHLPGSCRVRASSGSGGGCG